ncbi:WxL protein peptidoglycan domain-containing protein [Lacticaseibacillus jixianensis]|uniref:WxL protein peptidoglycan domain-containing protein n=1 Tax=Lacticaseibacillus jixianensis TaxID=2486012 RepID=A0ABW4BB24_9LACO|nr:DUF916 domain-containing protein [Lacticaseibacillus jixianensis]
MNKITRFFTAAMLGLVFGIFPQTVHAATVNNFTAQSVMPQDNIGDPGYVNLLLKPAQAHPLTVAVTNNADTPQKFAVVAANAVTNGNGLIVYDQGAKTAGPKHVSFTAMLVGKNVQDVTIPAHRTAKVTFNLKAPKKHFPGLVLGAFNVHSLTAAAKAKHQSGLSNLANYVLGVSLRESRTIAKADLTMQQARYHSASKYLALTMTNPKPVIIEDVQLKAHVAAAHGHKAVNIKRTAMSFAPSNQFTLQLPTNTALPAGRYRLHVDVKATNGHWAFDRSFTVSQKAATKSAVHRAAAHWPQYLMWAIDLLAVIIVVSYLVQRLRKHRQKKA